MIWNCHFTSPLMSQESTLTAMLHFRIDRDFDLTEFQAGAKHAFHMGRMQGPFAMLPPSCAIPVSPPT